MLTLSQRPAYIALKNNVSTVEMELSTQKWKPGTEEFVPHHVLAEYIQDTARANGILDVISFDTRVKHVEKRGDKWIVDLDQVVGDRTISSTKVTKFKSLTRFKLTLV